MAGGVGEEVGASGAGPELLPAEGTGVRDIPKEPRLQTRETKSRRRPLGKGWAGEMQKEKQLKETGKQTLRDMMAARSGRGRG